MSLSLQLVGSLTQLFTSNVGSLQSFLQVKNRQNATEKTNGKKFPSHLRHQIFFVFGGECRRSLSPGYRFNGPLQKCRR
jgi:ribosomal protein L33